MKKLVKESLNEFFGNFKSFDDNKLVEYFNSPKIESSKNNKYVNIARTVLKKNRERDGYTWQLFDIPDNFKVFKSSITVPKGDMGTPKECYDNAINYSHKTGLPLIIGFFIWKENIKNDLTWINKGPINKVNPFHSIYPHAWNLTESGDIYDTTIEPDLDKYVYVGIEVDANKFNDGFGELIPYLNKITNRNTDL